MLMWSTDKINNYNKIYSMVDSNKCQEEKTKQKKLIYDDKR